MCRCIDAWKCLTGMHRVEHRHREDEHQRTHDTLRSRRTKAARCQLSSGTERKAINVIIIEHLYRAARRLRKSGAERLRSLS